MVGFVGVGLGIFKGHPVFGILDRDWGWMLVLFVGLAVVLLRGRGWEGQGCLSVGVEMKGQGWVTELCCWMCGLHGHRFFKGARYPVEVEAELRAWNTRHGVWIRPL